MISKLLATAPCNGSNWSRKDDDVRWQFGVPPKGSANFGWVQHFIHHLAPHGMAASSSKEKMPRLVAELHAQFATLRDTLLPKLLNGELSAVETATL